MKYFDILYSLIGGSLSGFLTSYFFWRKDRKLHRPRLFLDGIEGSKSLHLINRGDSFAENIHLNIDNRTSTLDSPLAPLAKFPMGHFNGSDELVHIAYEDVFGTRFEDDWQVHLDELDDQLVIAKLK
jgi:hypothetical protein